MIARDPAADIAALLADARLALEGVPREALGVPRTSRWRAPRIVRAGAAWHIGVLLLTDDGLRSTGEVLRAAAPVRRGYAAESARARAERRAEASRGGFADGETVHLGSTPVDLAAVARGEASGPIALVDGIPMVRWSRAADHMPLAAYLREQIALLRDRGV